MNLKYKKYQEREESREFSSGSKAYCSNCQRYQQDIQILQEKLMQTHNKLIDQIDKSRQLQEQVNQLMSCQFTKQNKHSNHSSFNSRVMKKNEENLQNEQLRNDLEILRNKVLSETYKKNKLKQSHKQIIAQFSKQITMQKDKNLKLEALIEKCYENMQQLKEENEQLKQQIKERQQVECQRTQCQCGFQKKYYELDRAFMNQRALTNQLIEENNLLQNQLYEIKIKITVLNKNQEKTIQSNQKKEKSHKKIKNHSFQSTKNLIRRLEEEEREIRKTNLQ